jgi:hypothetical protein
VTLGDAGEGVLQPRDTRAEVCGLETCPDLIDLGVAGLALPVGRDAAIESPVMRVGYR